MKPATTDTAALLHFCEEELRNIERRIGRARGRAARTGQYLAKSSYDALVREWGELRAKVNELRQKLASTKRPELAADQRSTEAPSPVRSWEFEYDREPVDRVAARVTQPGVEFEPTITTSHADSEVRPPLKEPPLDTPTLVDLRGTRFGNMVVIGYAAHSSTKARWVVRCVCGRYSLRTSRAIRNPINAGDCCSSCDYLRVLKKRDFKRRTGSWPSEVRA